MSQNEVQLSYDDSSASIYSAPGKIFILGEYAVLAAAPAIVAAVGPRFKLKARPIQNDVHDEEGLYRIPSQYQTIFAPQSPVARLLDWFHHCGLPEFQFQFEDPFSGHGGFGVSSAQFVLAYYAMSHFTNWDLRWQKVWKLYRELNVRPEVSPSGADVVAQWRGSCTLFDPQKIQCQDLWPLMDWSGLLVFSTTLQNPTRKVATHEHLATLSGKNGDNHQSNLIQAKWILELKKVLAAGIASIHAGDPKALGKAMRNYADLLWKEGLESKETHEDRLELSHLPGVLGVKGVGAMQSDAILVLHQGSAALRELVIKKAEERGLQLISEGLSAEMGVRAL